MSASSEIEIRQQIHDCLLSYTRGIDRLDGALVAAGFHPGAMLHDYGAEPMTIEQFAEHAPGSLQRKFLATQHRVSNVAIELRGDHAVVETYVLAFHVDEVDGSRRLHTFNGRYIDRFEERDGAWKIVKRQLRNDWTQIEPISEPMSGSYVPSGRGGSPDPLWD